MSCGLAIGAEAGSGFTLIGAGDEAQPASSSASGSAIEKFRNIEIGLEAKNLL